MLGKLKALPLNDIRKIFKAYLLKQGFTRNTIQTALSDAFYIYRNEGAQIFWEIVESSNFDDACSDILNSLLPKQPNGLPNKNIPSYKSQVRRFRRFALSEDIDSFVQKPLAATSNNPRRKSKITVSIPTPCNTEVEQYLNSWAAMPDYSSQEAALDKLFFKLIPHNTNLVDILLKVSALNDFYSTNIFSVYPVAEHILSLNIDERLQAGDPTLVDAIMSVNGRNHYSFATKYCSHHFPLEYPIYDSYVDKILIHFRNADGFCNFTADDLKVYTKFKNIVLAFRTHYNLTQYNLKEIDQYLWQLGKKYYPKKYGTKK